MKPKRSATVVLRFIERVNAGDVDGLCALLREDHVFIDRLGNHLQGRDNLRAGWKGYFSWFPDYCISHRDIFENQEVVAVFGTVSGT